MLALYRVLVAVLVLAELQLGSAKKCERMTMSEMCASVRRCKHHILDLKAICRSMRKGNMVQEKSRFKKQRVLDSRATDVISIIKSSIVSYQDATVPLILEGPKNITVAPGGEIYLSCLVEGAPTPDITLSRREDSYIEKPIASLGNSIELSISKVVHKQVDVLYSDEGWYRCVGTNSEGVVYADAYVTVRDLCAEMDPPCPSNKICEADYDLQIAECVCPSCGDDDYFGDSWVCGSNCASYFSECSLDEDNCYEDTTYTVFKKSYCPDFTGPVFTVTPRSSVEVGYQEAITLSCAAEPAGIQPGPPPIITWYDEYDELIGEGNYLLLTPEDEMTVTCVAYHCPGTFGAQKVLQTDPVTITIKQERSKYHPGKSCQVFGDPHIITFDGTAYTHEGACDYVLAMDCIAASWFVYGRFSQCGNGMTCLQSVTLFYGYDVMLELQRGWLVNNDGDKLPIKLGQTKTVSGDVTLLFDGEWLTLTFGGNEIRWDGLMNMQLLIAPTSGTTCGLCGNNNGVMGDEFTSRRSYYGVESNIGRFIDSWRLDNDGICQLEGNKEEVTIEETEIARKVCSSLFSGDYIKQCTPKVEPAVYLEACIRDYTASGYKTDEYRIECSILQSYVQRCESKGVDLNEWRKHSSCTNISNLQNFIIAQGCPQAVSPLS